MFNLLIFIIVILFVGVAVHFSLKFLTKLPDKIANHLITDFGSYITAEKVWKHHFTQVYISKSFIDADRTIESYLNEFHGVIRHLRFPHKFDTIYVSGGFSDQFTSSRKLTDLNLTISVEGLDGNLREIYIPDLAEADIDFKISTAQKVLDSSDVAEVFNYITTTKNLSKTEGTVKDWLKFIQL